ncbi:hypothetical protein C2W64_00202 [Brevibacillus laterosporus]|uniref:PRD domain-containing protein n=1 Tax=Brevibacillus laterosporus TaxID=1465 RepID=A0A518VBQ0_BRELA|nr:PRD domain-containing protein [Brevibacillus laterosporus]QDX94421.1 PRD domain-containing protein [Brevibacillus laterosporus]RAP31030.1 hypothetical protein C2W64_00202 [Brevibacillus laterosporus]
MLSSRSREIVKTLVLAPEPLRIKEIAQDFQVSERTVKYDLDHVRAWLKERNIPLFSQPNKGIWLECQEPIKKQVMDWLQTPGSNEIFLHQNERARYIALELLCEENFLRIKDFTDRLLVSRNTIISDLEEVERFCSYWQLQFERKLRVGLRIVGKELQRRLALEQLMLDLLDGYEMFQLVQSISQEQDSMALAAPIYQRLKIDEKETSQLKESLNRVVLRVGKELQIHLSDRVLISLLIRMGIVVQRLRSGFNNQLDTLEISAIHQFSIFTYFQEELQVLFDQLSLPITDKEIAFICMPTIGMIVDPHAYEHRVDSQEQAEIYALTDELIQAVSDKCGIMFREDPGLMEHLFAHLADRIVKYRNGVLDPNPLTDDIIRTYPSLFTALKQICLEKFSKYQILLSNSDIAYIVLHFQAAQERLLEHKRVRALVVCGTGRGVARFLQTHLEKEVKTLHVVGLCSSLEVDSFLQSRSVDVIVSVIPLQAKVPVVQINALPTKQDREKLQSVLNTVKAKQVKEAPQAGALLATRTFTASTIPTQRATEITTSDSFSRGERTKFALLAENMSPAMLQEMENVTQDIILQGFEIGMKLTSRFAHLLPEKRQQGLFLHVLLMMNRLSHGSSYFNYETSGLQESRQMQAYRYELAQFFEQEQLELPPSELTAIMRYFTEERG